MQLPHKLQISYYQNHEKVTTDSFLGACDTSLKFVILLIFACII